MKIVSFTISKAKIYRVYTSLYALHGDVDSLFEYMRVLATQELNPAIIPPDVLKTILHKIENDIKSNARLKLCEDPNTNIWSYYGTNKVDTYCITGLPNAYFDCSTSRSDITNEPVQSAQLTNVASNLTIACAV